MLQFPKPLLNQNHNLAASFTKEIKKQVAEVQKHLQKHQLGQPLTTKHLFKRGSLKSALFSARIEGNPLTLESTKKIHSLARLTKPQQEVINLVNAHNQLLKLPSVITLNHILMLHQIIMYNLEKTPGKLRTKSSAIFDQLGNIVYLTPEPEEAKVMLDKLLTRYNTRFIQQTAALVNLAQCHYYFEKIHPFLDGNGRVGRLLVQWQLYQLYQLPISIPLEEFIDNHRSEYYFLLEKNTRQVDNFVIFILKAVLHALTQLATELKQTSHELTSTQTKNVDKNLQLKLTRLIPRQQAVYQVILDHPYASLDFIRRRFLDVSKRTLAYDVNKLVKLGLVVKHGRTRGVRYSATETSLNSPIDN